MAEKKILVNGAEMDEMYFRGNLENALGANWKRAVPLPAGTHSHCIICIAEITENEISYESPRGRACKYCYENYLRDDDGIKR